MTCVWRSENNLQESVLSFPHVGPWSWTQVIGLGGKLPFLPSLLNSLVFAFLKTALETTNCNLVADILRTAKEVKSTEQFWEESLIIIPIFHARLGESRWLRTGLFLELKSALVETYALSAHATVPSQTSSSLSFRSFTTQISQNKSLHTGRVVRLSSWHLYHCDFVKTTMPSFLSLVINYYFFEIVCEPVFVKYIYKLFTSFLKIYCIYVYMCAHVAWHVWGGQRTTFMSQFFSSSALNNQTCHAWGQTPFTTEPAHGGLYWLIHFGKYL